MGGKINQGVCFKFCVKFGKSVTETLKMLREGFGEHSLSRTAVFEWHSRFKACRVSVEDDKHSQRPNTSKTTENVKKIQELIHVLADTDLISYGVCQEILTGNLNMRRFARSLFPNS
jgi:hypothetical protein